MKEKGSRNDIKAKGENTMNETAKEAIKEGKAVLGIEFGSTRIKAVLVDVSHAPIAMGTTTGRTD